MQKYIKTFDEFLNASSEPSEPVEEVKVSFKEFLKFANSENFESNSGSDVLLILKNPTKPEELDSSEIKKIKIQEENWSDLSKSDYNFFRKKDIYTFEEFLDFVKKQYKNKISF